MESKEMDLELKNGREKKKDIFDRIMSLKVFRRWEPFYKKKKELLLYLFFGGLTTAVSIVSYSVCVFSGIDELIANVISWILAVLFAYVTNSIWVFESDASGLKEKFNQMVRFYSGRLATLGMEELVILVFVKLLGFNSYVVKFAAQVMVMVGNYIISKVFVFKKSKKGIDE